MRQQSLTLSAQVNGRELAPAATRNLLACLQDHMASIQDHDVGCSEPQPGSPESGSSGSSEAGGNRAGRDLYLVSS